MLEILDMLDALNIEGWRSLPASILTSDSEGRVVMRLPTDFRVLVSLRLEGWERPVREILRPDNWLYRLQSARWTGLRGTPQRPLAFFAIDADGNRALELFSSQPDSEVRLMEFSYLGSPEPP